MEDFIRGLNIMHPHVDDLDDFCGAEHDIIYFYVNDSKISEDSPEGIELIELGFHLDADVGSWARFV